METRYIKMADNPDWDGFDNIVKPIHDWRTYVTDEVREMWETIRLAGRYAIVSICEEMASNENWD